MVAKSPNKSKRGSSRKAQIGNVNREGPFGRPGVAANVLATPKKNVGLFSPFGQSLDFSPSWPTGVSFVRHPCFAQAGEERAVELGDDSWHYEVCAAPQVGDA
jgi:hypothetical protein